MKRTLTLFATLMHNWYTQRLCCAVPWPYFRGYLSIQRTAMILFLYVPATVDRNLICALLCLLHQYQRITITWYCCTPTLPGLSICSRSLHLVFQCHAQCFFSGHLELTSSLALITLGKSLVYLEATIFKDSSNFLRWTVQGTGFSLVKIFVQGRSFKWYNTCCFFTVSDCYLYLWCLLLPETVLSSFREQLRFFTSKSNTL